MVVSNAQGGDLGFLVCLLELPVSLAQTVILGGAVKVFLCQNSSNLMMCFQCVTNMKKCNL